MEIQLISEPATLALVQEMAKQRFGDMTKASVDDPTTQQVIQDIVSELIPS